MIILNKGWETAAGPGGQLPRLLAGVAVTAATAGVGWATGLGAGRAGEAAFYMGLLVLLSGQRQLTAALDALAAPLCLLVVGFAVALCAAQIAGVAGRAYPLIEWEMYTVPVTGDPCYYEFTGATAGGEPFELPVADVFASLGRRMALRLSDEAGGQVAVGEGPNRNRPSDRFEAILRTIGAKYNADHPDAATAVIDVWKCIVPLKEYGGRQSIRRRHSLRIEL